MIRVAPLEQAVAAAPGTHVAVDKTQMAELLSEHKRLQGMVGTLQRAVAIGTVCADISGAGAR